MKYIWVCTQYLLITNVYFGFVFTAEREDNWSSICGGHQHGRWAAEHCAGHRGDFRRDRPSSTSGSAPSKVIIGNLDQEGDTGRATTFEWHRIKRRAVHVISVEGPGDACSPEGHREDCLCRLGQGGDGRPASITLAKIPEGMFKSPIFLPREKCTIAPFCRPATAAISRPTAVPNSAAIFCPSLWHPAAVPSLPQRLTKHLDYQRRMAASSPSMACSRPARPVRVGITRSPLGAEPDEHLFWPSSDSTAAGAVADDGPARCPGHQQHPVPWRGSLVQSVQLCRG